MKKFIKFLLGKFGLEITRSATFRMLISSQKSKIDYDFLLHMPRDRVGQILDLMELSKSQLRQDLFVLNHLNFKKNGFFVEFGATNGVDLSNSFILEKTFEWKGILAEPARIWHEQLRVNRNATIVDRCVWSESNKKIEFREVDIPELSTTSQYLASDYHVKDRSSNTAYSVETVSLHDLLIECNAPKTIDYLSIDTEGSEYEIIKNFDFDQFNIEVITIEHNHTPQREKIFDLLTAKGYIRRFPEISDFDDWYVKSYNTQQFDNPNEVFK